MNLKNVEVMENTQKTNKNRFLPAGIGAGALMAGSWRHTPFRNEWPPFCEWASVFMATYAI